MVVQPLNLVYNHTALCIFNFRSTLINRIHEKFGVIYIQTQFRIVSKWAARKRRRKKHWRK